jgi:DNA-binding HxlR family transcriptional regulator
MSEPNQARSSPKPREQAVASPAQPKLEPRFPNVVLPPPNAKSCPIKASLGVLGRKWALVVLRDIAFFRGVRFSDILRRNPGLTPRVLVFRLKELEEEGFIERMRTDDKREVAYDLLPKGMDAIPILAALAYFGTKHYAEQVFTDGKARPLGGMFPDAQHELLQGMAAWAAKG